MENFDIRFVKPEELETLAQISIQTFLETFAAVNTAENMQQYLEGNFSPSQLKSELENPDAEFYFAESVNNVVGYLKLNFGQTQTELKEPNGIEIERIYVLKEFHGTGVGKLLFNTALQAAKRREAAYVWLGVWEHNINAIGFYKRNGFVAFDKHIFRLGDDEQTDIMMKLELNAEVR